MIEATALLVGIGLGLRHATDADHVVVVASALEREPSVLRAARVAALWGLGHTLSFLAIGLLVVLAGVRVPASFETLIELAVGTMLVVLGFWHLWRSLRPGPPGESAPPLLARGRPLLIGLVHGLAGSAGIALIVTTTITSRSGAVVYLVLFGGGTVAGMVLLTALLSWPIAWAAQRKAQALRTARALAAGVSVIVGATVLLSALSDFGDHRTHAEQRPRS
jgi:nickel/cobalt transporter (NicO) family protein